MLDSSFPVISCLGQGHPYKFGILVHVNITQVLPVDFEILSSLLRVCVHIQWGNYTFFFSFKFHLGVICS